MSKEEQFVNELIGYIFAYPDDDYMTMECLCRKLHKHGLIDKKDGEWTTDFIERKTEPTISKMEQVEDEPQTEEHCETCKHWEYDAKYKWWHCPLQDNGMYECHYEPRKLTAVEDEPTSSKMEQVDKDINVRSKTESNSEIPNNCEACANGEGDIEACGYCRHGDLYEPKDEPQTCEDCKHNGEKHAYDYACDKCTDMDKFQHEDEPQTQLTAKCLNCNNSKVCKEKHWDGCVYEPKDEKTCETCRHWKYIAHEWQCEACKCQGYEPKDEPQTDDFFREPTEEEMKAVREYIDSISVPTGVNVFDLMDEPQTEYERASEQREHDILYEPTYDLDNGSM